MRSEPTDRAIDALILTLIVQLIGLLVPINAVIWHILPLGMILMGILRSKRGIYPYKQVKQVEIAKTEYEVIYIY